MQSSEPSLVVPSSSLIPLSGSVSQEPVPSKIIPYNSTCKSYILYNGKFSKKPVTNLQFMLVLNSKKNFKNSLFFFGKPNYTSKENVHHLFPQNTSQIYVILEREISTIL